MNEEAKKRAKFARIRRVYGIDETQYLELLGKECVICLRPFEGTVKPVIDHDHKTGEIRGIICGYCNHRVVGRHRDPDLMQRVADYLRTSKTGWFVPKKRKRKGRRRK